ncbi:MAG: hypothetical protein ABI910_24095, partial [Gemmatimonadota bacterium]
MALLSTTGCFTYRPVTVADLQPEMTVHMQLTAVAVDRLRNAPNGERRLLDGFALDGMVTSAGEDSVIVSVPTSNASDPSMRAMQFRQPLTIRRGEVEQIQLRTLDRKKTTWVAVTLSVLGVAAAAYAIRRGGEATGSTPVPGGPNESRG